MTLRDDTDDTMARWTVCWFCGAVMRVMEARHLSAPFAGASLPACPDCVVARERAHSAHAQTQTQQPLEAKK